MLENIASRLTDQLYLHCPLDQRKKVIYTYGIQLSLSTLASMCSIVLLGILLGDAPSAFLFWCILLPSPLWRRIPRPYLCPLFPAHKLRLPRRGGSKLLDRGAFSCITAPCNRCGVMCSRDGSFSDSKQTPSVVRENLPEEPKDRCCSGFHREFAFPDSFLLADLSALCDRLHHVVNSGCCYDASHLKWKESKTMTSLVRISGFYHCDDCFCRCWGCFYWLWLSARTAQGASEVITSSKEKALSFGWGLSSGLITIPAYTAPPR